jgi:integrase
MALTDKQIQALKPKASPASYADGHGLALMVSPDGSKWWRWRYRFGGKQNNLGFGAYPGVSLADARAQRETYRAVVAQGINPSEQRKTEADDRKITEANTFRKVALEWHRIKSTPSAPNAKAKRKVWTDQTTKETLRRLEGDLFPILGGLPIAEITTAQILRALRAVEDRGAPETAKKCLQHVTLIFKYAVQESYRKDNPARECEGALVPVESTPMPATKDPARLGEILRAIDGYKGTSVVRAILKLSPLLFQRPNEMQKMRWSQIDLEAKEWRFVTSKTKVEHIVPLCSQAVAILSELQPYTGHREFVLPGIRHHNKPVSENTVNAALRNLGIDDQTGHGFRATARTILDEKIGVRVDFSEHQLAHAVKDPNGRSYNRTSFLDQRHAMMQYWGDYLDNLRDHGGSVPMIKWPAYLAAREKEREAEINVVPIKSRAA